MGWPKGKPHSPEHRAKIAESRRAASAAGAVSPRKGRHGPVTCLHPDRPYFAKGQCRSCYQMAWQRTHPRETTWAQDHPERQKYLLRRHTLRSRYGLTHEDVAELFARQGDKCANPRCTVATGLEVDHDHVTGRVRGLLCPPCNKALGSVNDDRVRLAGLIEYLERA